MSCIHIILLDLCFTLTSKDLSYQLVEGSSPQLPLLLPDSMRGKDWKRFEVLEEGAANPLPINYRGSGECSWLPNGPAASRFWTRSLMSPKILLYAVWKSGPGTTVPVRIMTFWGPGTLSSVLTKPRNGVPVRSGLLSPPLVLISHLQHLLLSKTRQNVLLSATNSNTIRARHSTDVSTNNKLCSRVHKPTYYSTVPTIRQVSHFVVTHFRYVLLQKQPFPVNLVWGCVGECSTQ